MKTSSTFRIMFWANIPKAKENKATIYARITVNGKRASFSLNRKVDLAIWPP